MAIAVSSVISTAANPVREVIAEHFPSVRLFALPPLMFRAEPVNSSPSIAVFPVVSVIVSAAAAPVFVRLSILMFLSVRPYLGDIDVTPVRLRVLPFPSIVRLPISLGSVSFVRLVLSFRVTV